MNQPSRLLIMATETQTPMTDSAAYGEIQNSMASNSSSMGVIVANIVGGNYVSVC